MSNPDDADATEPQPPVSSEPAWAAPPPPPPRPSTPAPPIAGPPVAAPGAYQVPPPAMPPRTEVRRERQSRRRALGALAMACFLACAAILGYSIGSNHGSNSSSASVQFPTQQTPNTGQSSNGSSSSSSSGQNTNIDVQGIAAKVSPSIVNLTSATNEGEAAGTGIVLTSSGLVLTNNHVIASSNQLQAEIGGDGNYHDVKVLGYSLENDVALVQIEDVSGLTPATIGDASSAQVGDAIVALGNAGGKGGDPTVVSGSITDLNQQITASDQDGSNAETLHDLIQIDANIQPGDSGGALVDADGKVIGMNSAASSGNGGFGFGGQSTTNEGYAITIQDALAIAKSIQSGDGTDAIHVGAHSGILGVAVSDDGSSNGYGNPTGGNGDFGGSASGGTSTGNGAYVESVQQGSGADNAGITEGSTISSVDGQSVTSAANLTHFMVRHNPGDKVKVEWTDANGQSHTATVELGSGPPA